jgi:glutathione synthase/RimK-type ligase-like ATP-grasp enzyme
LADPTARLGFLTYSGAPDLTEDDRLALGPVGAFGAVVDRLVWDDPGVDWRPYTALILRSTWDYHKKSSAFVSWLDQIESLGVPLWNPAGLIRWNMDKTYLRKLAAKGVPVTPTEWLEPGSVPDLSALLNRNGWDRAVVKPTLSATAFLTWVTTPAGARGDQPRLDEMTQRGGVMVQRFEEAIREGEWSLVFFRGELSHAVLKQPRAGDFRVQKEYGGTSVPGDPPPRVVATAEHALAQVEFPWLYARVDLVDSESGVRLMELEMLEPDLFLRHSAGAADRFAAAIYSVFPPLFSQAE